MGLSFANFATSFASKIGAAVLKTNIATSLMKRKGKNVLSTRVNTGIKLGNSRSTVNFKF